MKIKIEIGDVLMAELVECAHRRLRLQNKPVQLEEAGVTVSSLVHDLVKREILNLRELKALQALQGIDTSEIDQALRISPGD